MGRTKATIISTGLIGVAMLALPSLANATDVGTVQTDNALQTLKTLTVQPQADDYSQSKDRPKDWKQNNNNPGDESNTRDTILARDLTNVTYNNKTKRVASGTLDDPYTGKTIHFVQGTHSNDVQIDHVVAFGEAWESGLDKADTKTVDQYYNDPYVLLAVDGPSNGTKSDSDAAEWLPSTGKKGQPGNKDYDCWYVARQIGIKQKYDLTVDDTEQQVMAKTLASCPTMTVPTAGGAYWKLPSDDSPTIQYSADDLKNVTLTVENGRLGSTFTPTKSSQYTIYVPEDSQKQVKIAANNIPANWTVKQEKLSITITSPDGKVSVAYKFTISPETEQPSDTSVEELKDVTAWSSSSNSDGTVATSQQVSGFNPLKDGSYQVDENVTVELRNIPQDWKLDKSVDDKTKTITFTLTKDDTQVTYVFQQTTKPDNPSDKPDTPKYSTADLKGLKFVDDGKPVDFTPDKFDYTAADPSKVTLDDSSVPNGWKAERTVLDNGSVTFTVTAPDGVFSSTYVFAQEKNDEQSSEPAENQNTPTNTQNNQTNKPAADKTTGNLARTGAAPLWIGVAALLLLTIGGVLSLRRRKA